MSKNIGHIIASIAIAAFLFVWSIVDYRLKTLETEMRGLRLQVTAISVKVGVEPKPLSMIKDTQSNLWPDKVGGEDTEPLTR